MRRLFALCAVALFIAALTGCGGKKEEEAADIPVTASVNNKDPRAATAPAAESDPSIPYPGKQKGKVGGK